MLAVRYVTLTALVIWLGGLVALELVSSSFEAERQFEAVAYGCGAVMLVGLLVLKFVGPPPHDFFPRAGLASLMLAVAIYAGFWRPASVLPAAIDIAIGFTLLSWYVRE